MVRQRIVGSLNRAIEGFIYVLRTQRNMRIHFLLGILILELGIYYNVPKLELLFLTGVITFVIALEMINTSIELTIDLVKSKYHPLARVIKDVAAGAVFLAVLNAIITGYIIFSRRFSLHADVQIARIAHSPWHLTFITLILVIFLVVCGKVFFHKGTPFKGGMPSGHAAVAFSVWTIITFFTENGLISALTFVMAFLIARHRLKDGIHNIWEVIAGACLGVLVTALIFQFLV